MNPSERSTADLERLLASVDEAADQLELCIATGDIRGRFVEALRALTRNGRMALLAEADGSVRSDLCGRLETARHQAIAWIFEGAEPPPSQRTTLLPPPEVMAQIDGLQRETTPPPDDLDWRNVLGEAGGQPTARPRGAVAISGVQAVRSDELARETLRAVAG